MVIAELKVLNLGRSGTVVKIGSGKKIRQIDTELRSTITLCLMNWLEKKLARCGGRTRNLLIALY